MSGERVELSRAYKNELPVLVHGVVRGANHARAGAPCQDAVRAERRDGLLAVAIADGHGTATHGDVGADLAVQVAVDQLLEFARGLGPSQSILSTVHAYAEHPLRVQIVRGWAERVRAHAGSPEARLEAYGTTLVFALVAHDYLLLGQLGDGDILVVSGDRAVTRPIPHDPSLFAEETTSLCLDGAWVHLHVVVMPLPIEKQLVVLSTDGYSKSYASDADFERIGPDYLDLFERQGAARVEGALPDFLNRVSEGGSGDDIAAAFLYWRPASPSVATDPTRFAAAPETTEGMTKCEES